MKTLKYGMIIKYDISRTNQISQIIVDEIELGTENQVNQGWLTEKIFYKEKAPEFIRIKHSDSEFHFQD